MVFISQSLINLNFFCVQLIAIICLGLGIFMMTALSGIVNNVLGPSLAGAKCKSFCCLLVTKAVLKGCFGCCSTPKLSMTTIIFTEFTQATNSILLMALESLKVKGKGYT